MSVRIITPPGPIVSIEELDKHLSGIPTEDHAYVHALAIAATALLDGPNGWLGKALGAQLLEYVDDCPASPIVSLPCGPIIEVDAAWSGEYPLDVASYRRGAAAISFGTQLVRGRPLRIRYWAGWAKRSETDPGKWVSEVPMPLKVAIMMLVAQWYNVRENAVIGSAVAELPFAVTALVSPYRTMTI